MKLKSAFAIISLAIIAIAISSCSSSNQACDAYQAVELEDVQARTGSK